MSRFIITNGGLDEICRDSSNLTTIKADGLRFEMKEGRILEISLTKDGNVLAISSQTVFDDQVFTVTDVAVEVEIHMS